MDEPPLLQELPKLFHCPECARTFETCQKLSVHRHRTHKIVTSAPVEYEHILSLVLEALSAEGEIAEASGVH